MTLLACGINHKSVPVSVREKLVFTPEQIPSALNQLLSHGAVNEAMLLSTCNRTEIYATSHEETSAVFHWLAEQLPAPYYNLASYSYAHHDEAMVRHVMRVASGLDSMVLGEAQILGQLKQAYHLAHSHGTIGAELTNLFPAVFAASKRIRHQTAIGASPISLAYAVVQLAKRIFPRLSDCQALLIGAGETIELVSSHLHGQGLRGLYIANRTLKHAERLAATYQANAIPMGDIPTYLSHVDIVISATRSPLPVVGKGAVERALRRHNSNSRRPLFMADLALPRDIEPEVAELKDVHLYNIDDLQTILAENWKNRETAAKQAEVMVEMQATHYMRQLRVLKAGDMIRQFRERLERVRDQELARALIHWRQTQNPELAMAYLAHNLTKKILHQPTIKLRQAAYEEMAELLWCVKELFEL